MAVTLISAVILAAPADRFTGAICDGYDQKSYIQTSGTNSYPLINARFNGGTCDGYDRNSVANTSVLVPGVSVGTVYRFR